MNKITLKAIAILMTLSTALWYLSRNESIAPEIARYNHHQNLLNEFEASNSNNIKDLPKQDRPDLAYLQDFERTKDPSLGYPPSERRFEAYRIAKERLRKKSAMKAIDNVTWDERGPNNFAGRTRALMFDPNDSEAKKVWAGGTTGGLWYNNDITDPSSKWIAVDNFMANLAVTDITYDPNNPQVFYLTTGNGWFNIGSVRGAGVFKSIDAGATWTQLASTNNENFTYIQRVQVTSSGAVLVATRSSGTGTSGIYRSIDGGDNWTSVIEGRGADIKIATDDVIFASTGFFTEEGFMYKSMDDGVTWQDITPHPNGLRIIMAVSPSNSDVVYAVSDGGGSGTDEVAFFVKSKDQGETWEDLAIPGYMEQDCETNNLFDFTRAQAWFCISLGVLPNDEEKVIVGGIDLHRTLNGGEDWELISYWTGGCDDYVHADQHSVVFRPGHPTEGLFGTDGGVYYSKNLEDIDPHFESRNHGYNITQFYAVATANSPNSHYYLAGAQDNGTIQLSNAGAESGVKVTGGDGGFCFIDQDNSDLQVTSYIYNSYRVSQDGGETFTDVVDDQTLGNFINPSAYDSETNTLYGSGNDNQFTRIKNIDGAIGGLSLETINVSVQGSISHIKPSPHTTDVIYVGGEGAIKVARIRSANTGSPITEDITGNLLSEAGTVSSIDIGETESHLLVTFFNYGAVSVFETTDGGISWVNKEGNLPDMPVRWGIFNPNNRSEVLLATEVGVWSTDDITIASPEWEPTNAGLANVRCDMIRYRESDGQVIVATYGRGVFTSNVFAVNPAASFKADRLVAYEGVAVNFEDVSQAANDSWAWSFGDGGSSTEQHTSHTFTTAGTYDVTLSIDGGNSSSLQTITVLPSKPTPYGLADGGDFETNHSDFLAISLLNGQNLWELGIPSGRLATVSSGTNAWKTDLDADLGDIGLSKFALYTPSYDFSETEADYKVKFKMSAENSYCNAPFGMQLQYSTDGGSIWETLGSDRQEYGSVNWYNRGVVAGCELAFNMFENQIGWNFVQLEDEIGSDDTIENENTEHKLNFLIGESNVSFRFVVAIVPGYSTYDRDGFMIDDFEIVKSEPTAEFSVNNTVSPIGGELTFKYESAGALSYLWDFGDGNTSVEKDPIHSYSTSGLFSVSLTITNNTGTVVETKTDLITILSKYTPEYLAADGGDFETMQSDFVAENIAGTPFELGNSNVAGKDGTASGNNAWVTGLTENAYQNDSEARLYSPVFDLSEAQEYTLHFKAKYRFEDEWDGFIVEYSKDLGASWVKLNNVVENGWYTTISHPQAVFGAMVPIFSGSTNNVFEEYSTDLTFLLGEENVMIRFLFLSDANATDAGLALDDFEVTKADLVPAIPQFEVSSRLGCSGHVITFNSTSTGTIASYDWDFGAGATPSKVTGIGPHAVTYNVEVETFSDVKLTVNGYLNGEVVEEKSDFVATGPSHTPTISLGAVEEGATTIIASDGDAYQWYFQNEIIEGADQKSYVATQNGVYFVEVTASGCTRFSSNFEVDIVTSIDGPENVALSVYPNPSQGVITIINGNFLNGLNKTVLKLHDLTGKLLIREIINTENSEHDFSSLRKGTYILELSNGNSRKSKRIILN
ncbi:MAG: PKD domain-containing protein [Reichenbachiella sp.]